jgi:predicted transporter
MNGQDKLRVLRILYRVNAIILFSILLISFAAGMFIKDGWASHLRNAVANLCMMAILVCPLCVTLLLLNVWGLRIDPKRRLRYIIEMLVLSVWIAWAVYEYVTLPMLAP